MSWSNGTTIDKLNLNWRLASCTATTTQPLSGTDITEQFRRGNGFTMVRFKQKNLVHNTEYKFRFVSPDDYDIFLAGLDIQYKTALGAGTNAFITAEIKGSTGDAQNDLPVNDHLFLTEPVSNVDGEVKSSGGEVIKDKLYVEVKKPGVVQQFGTRYTSYLLDENKSCNTLLKGASYDVTFKALDDPLVTGNPHVVNLFLMLKVTLRRN